MRVDLSAEELGKPNLYAADGKQCDALAGGEVGEKVDIGVRGGFAARGRAEQAQMGEAGCLEFGSVRTKDREDAVSVHFERSLAHVVEV